MSGVLLTETSRLLTEYRNRIRSLEIDNTRLERLWREERDKAKELRLALKCEVWRSMRLMKKNAKEEAIPPAPAPGAIHPLPPRRKSVGSPGRVFSERGEVCR